jgi:hypothetical protein
MVTTILDFRVLEESLDLNPDTEVQFEISNPLFETDNLPGTLAYPFTVPNTPAGLSGLLGSGPAAQPTIYL